MDNDWELMTALSEITANLYPNIPFGEITFDRVVELGKEWLCISPTCLNTNALEQDRCGECGIVPKGTKLPGPEADKVMLRISEQRTINYSSYRHGELQKGLYCLNHWTTMWKT